VPDLWAVNRQGGSDSTEIHVISGADRSKFLLHSGTALHPTNEDWHFSVADYDQDGVLDLWAIKTQGGSDSTEIHVISGADRSQFLLKSSTALPNTNKDWRFLVTDYDQDGVPDLWAIDRQGGSDSTEIHIISGADRNKFLLYSSTALHPTNENWCFGEGECATDLADEYSIYLPILHKP
jgi:hypothetical protein